MFTTGEFARLAQVSKRLLRYYDGIRLLEPAHTDPSTGDGAMSRSMAGAGVLIGT